LAQTHRLVVDVAVHVALLAEEAAHVVGPPARPVVRREHDLGVVAVQVDRLADVLRPGERVAGLGAADRDEVVHVVRAVLGHAQPASPARHRSGKKKFISAGASVSGVSWNTMRTPSTTSS
jgi:hypothetical protein